MNRFGLLTDAIGDFTKELFDSRRYPYREVGPDHPKYWLGVSTNLFMRGYLAAEYIDSHNIPETGAAIIAANHSSHLDGWLINASTALAVRRQVTFLAAADLYSSNTLFRLMCKAVDCIPIKRDESDKAALLKTIKLLRQERLLGIFPEGGRSTDGTIGEGKPGVAVIALATGCSVIPAAISGTFEALPKKGRIIRPAKVRIKFGTPLLFGKEKNAPEEKVLWVRDHIMSEIKKLHREMLYEKERKLTRVLASKA